MNDLTTRLERLRDAMGLKKKAMAACLGVSYQTYWYWENNERRPSKTALALMDCLEKSYGVAKNGTK